MKTILEWFQGFPEPYRTQAIENWKKDEAYDAEQKAFSNFKALSLAFWFSQTIEGECYWSDFYNKLENGLIEESSVGWQPISTSPKDGTFILACSQKNYMPQSICWASYHPNAKGKECWRTNYIGGNKTEGLTHWMPLPEPPTQDN